MHGVELKDWVEIPDRMDGRGQCLSYDLTPIDCMLASCCASTGILIIVNFCRNIPVILAHIKQFWLHWNWPFDWIWSLTVVICTSDHTIESAHCESKKYYSMGKYKSFTHTHTKTRNWCRSADAQYCMQWIWWIMGSQCLAYRKQATPIQQKFSEVGVNLHDLPLIYLTSHGVD